MYGSLLNDKEGRSLSFPHLKTGDELTPVFLLFGPRMRVCFVSHIFVGEIKKEDTLRSVCPFLVTEEMGNVWAKASPQLPNTALYQESGIL